MSSPLQVANENVDALNAHDEERLRATYAEGATVQAPGVRLTGPDEATQYVMSWLRAFPDARQTIVNELVAGDWVVHEFTFTGTHTGTLTSPDGDIPPTNRSVTGHGVQIQRIERGRIVDERVYFDQVEMLSQLGLMPEPTPA